MKKLLTVILTIVLLCIAVVPAYASDDYSITPYYNNTMNHKSIFTISESGEATVSITVTGYQGVTTRIVITYTIQKNVLGSIWSTVEGAEWSGEKEGDSFSVTHTYQMPGSDKYRIVYRYEVYGTAGDGDLITGFVNAEY